METVTLNNGYKLPLQGFGVFQITDLKQCEESVGNALKAGYRFIDTAACYGNEKAVGNAIANSGIARNEICIASKVWIQDSGYKKTMKSFEKTLENLKTDYIDLYLIHMPYGDYHGSWRAMEELYHAGKIRAIGVSNFLPHHIENLMQNAKVTPAVDQLEYHPGYTQQAAVDYCRKNQILVEAWSPIGRRRVFEEPLILELSEKYHVSPAQICLRFALQNGVIPMPKSSSMERMKENQDIFSFEISTEDMYRLETMPQIGWSGEHPDRERVYF